MGLSLKATALALVLMTGCRHKIVVGIPQAKPLHIPKALTNDSDCDPEDMQPDGWTSDHCHNRFNGKA